MQPKEIVYSFLNKYQELLNFVNDTSDMDEQFQVSVKEELLSNIDVIRYISNCTNMPEAPNYQPYFYFLNELVEVHDVIIFARNSTYSFNYAIKSLNGEIIILDDQFEEVYTVAKDEISFIKVLTTLTDYELIVLTTKGQQNVELCRRFQKRCVELAGGDKYNAYYELILYIE